MSRAQLKWCMKAALPAGLLVCRLELVRKFLVYGHEIHGTNIREELRLIQQEAKAVKRAVGREIPEAEAMERSARAVVKAMTTRGRPLDEAILEAKAAVKEAQKSVKAVIEKASKARCAGAKLPEELDTLFRAAELSGRRRR